MPVFNRCELVRIMIQSIIDNTYSDWELLAVDDGSTDGTIEMMQQMSVSEPRLKVLQRNRQPKGAQTCRNIGMDTAKGDFIIFFDSDDYITTCCLQNRIQAIHKKPNLDFMIFAAGIHEDKNRHIRYGGTQNNDYHIDLKLLLSLELPFIVCTNIYNLKSLRDHKIRWDEQIQSLQDSQFNIDTLLVGLKYDYSSTTEPDYLYRSIVPGSIQTNIAGNNHTDSHLYVAGKTYSNVHKKYGDKYNLYLFRMALFLAHKFTSSEPSLDDMRRLQAIVSKYDILRAKILNLFIFEYKCLLKLGIDNRTVHRLVFAPYSICRHIRISRRLNKLNK